jgi:hypothetical protein
MQAEEPDRVRVAERLLRHRSLLVARIRRQLARVGAPANDAEDVLSTTLRRTDVLAAAGRLAQGISDEHLLALATAVARLAAHESGRRHNRDLRRLSAAEDLLRAEQSPAGAIVAAAPPIEDSESLLRSLAEEDLEILGLRLRGLDWPLIAAELGTTPAGAHRRYYRAMQRLCERAPKES